MKTLSFFFQTVGRVNRKTYFLTGVILMLVKYFGEAGFYYLAVQKFLTPLEFLNPIFHQRYPQYTWAPDWFVPVVVLWSLPFIWVGLSLSLRRALDAGRSPWWALMFFIPGLNFLMMFAFSLLPSSQRSDLDAEEPTLIHPTFKASFILTMIFAIVGTLFAGWSTNLLKTYGVTLFLLSPLFLGIFQGFLMNIKQPQGLRSTIFFCCMTVLLVHLFLLIFALEGMICLAMSLPLSLVAVVIGALGGMTIARTPREKSMKPMVLMLVLPAMPAVEKMTMQSHQDVVVSRIIIDAPPEQVWPFVVKFADLPPPTEFLFQLGVAHPLRARIEGEGVGAIRYCEFSTGAFVEPITTWDEPHHLAFDVRYQPQPMKEVSFYDHVDTPHLDGYFRSVKGEFRLIPLGNGQTELVGRTWYEMDMHPGWYWQIYGRWFIHQIHLRVLNHIRNLSESPK